MVTETTTEVHTHRENHVRMQTHVIMLAMTRFGCGSLGQNDRTPSLQLICAMRRLKLFVFVLSFSRVFNDALG